ncbi:helix-turn-helix domain-containing protein [Serratia fonticola]|uniref:helix-turn-helix domain-containing protein n=1 Tax=Serratia fonticola TaxID=47917 RepID=UPI000E0F14B4|nr:helix-turn-helix domain-containing protein [Serratia fonticola]RDL18879.1 regulatory LuxR family protein [Serratia fonticola]
MGIYVVTENNFFFIGIKEQLPFEKGSIKKIHPNELEINSTATFYRDDVFIFHTSNFGIETSFLISTGGFPGKLIFIPTTSKEKFKLAFNRYVFLDTYATIDEITTKIINNNEHDSLNHHVISEPLTKREKTIMCHTINGMNVYKISQYLSISTKTVYSHRRSAFHKLGGRNLFEIWPFRGNFLRTPRS